jgi:hypothetical protein
MPAIVAACAVLAVSGYFLFSAGIVFDVLLSALMAVLVPRGFAVYPFAVLAPSFVLATRDGARASAFLTLLIACASAALGGRLFIDARDAKTEASVRKRLSRLSYMIWALTLFPLYPAAKIGWVRIQVRRFCGNVHPGDAVNGLEARAQSLGLDFRSEPAARDGSRKAELQAWQGFVFVRTFCEVEYEGKHVTHARSSFLD